MVNQESMAPEMLVDTNILQEVIAGTLYDIGIVDKDSLYILVMDPEVQQRYVGLKTKTQEEDGLNFRTFLQNRLDVLKK